MQSDFKGAHYLLRYRLDMAETIMFTAFALGLVLVAGLAIIGRTRSRAMPWRGSGAGFDPGSSHMWIGDSSSSDTSSSDCAPADSSCDGGSSGGDGGGGSGGSD